MHDQLTHDQVTMEQRQDYTSSQNRTDTLVLLSIAGAVALMHVLTNNATGYIATNCRP